LVLWNVESFGMEKLVRGKGTVTNSKGSLRKCGFRHDLGCVVAFWFPLFCLFLDIVVLPQKWRQNNWWLTSGRSVVRSALGERVGVLFFW
jgi:hypothetical protein